MNTTLYELIDTFAAHPHTVVRALRDVLKDGMTLRNETLHMNLDIYSDRDNCVYLEFKPFKLSSKSYISDEFLIYKIEDFTQARPILDNVLHYLDKNMNKLNPLASEYIALFRKVLQNKELPSKYSFDDSFPFYQIINNDTKLQGKVSKHELSQVTEWMDTVHTPTPLMDVEVKGLHDGSGRIYFYIPKYLENDYLLIKKPTKIVNPYDITTSFNEWINKMAEHAPFVSNEFNAILKYVQLKNNLPAEDTADQKENKKPKI